MWPFKKRQPIDRETEKAVENVKAASARLKKAVREQEGAMDALIHGLIPHQEGPKK